MVRKKQRQVLQVFEVKICAYIKVEFVDGLKNPSDRAVSACDQHATRGVGQQVAPLKSVFRRQLGDVNYLVKKYLK